MSEYADIRINALSLYCFKNFLKKEVVELLFSKSDLTIISNYIEDIEDEDTVPYTKYVYGTTVKKARERLDVMGYGLDRFEKLFNQRMIDIIDYNPFLAHLHVDIEDREEMIGDRILKNVSFRKWINSMKKTIDYELKYGNISCYKKPCDIKLSTECDKIIYYALIDEYVSSYYALDTEIINGAYIMRVILECCEESDEIVLDFTNLGEWDEDSITKAIEATSDPEKTIVLVEGSSDKDILEFVLKRMYPHLADLFYFIDFTDEFGNKRGGGTAEIRKYMETFYYSKLRAKFIAVFDNDAEGYHSKYILMNEKVKSWPDNFRILCYPELPDFKRYPTLAPNGRVVYDDINKKACSIELYLPDSIISNEGGYIPVEWESREKIKKNDGSVEFLYQGVISNKDDIKKTFYKMKNDIENGKSTFVLKEWERMRCLLERIVFSFK